MHMIIIIITGKDDNDQTEDTGQEPGNSMNHHLKTVRRRGWSEKRGDLTFLKNILGALLRGDQHPILQVCHQRKQQSQQNGEVKK